MTDELTQLKTLLAEQVELLAEKDARIAYLEEQFLLAQKKQFGVSSEGHPGQGELFNEAESEAEHLEEEAGTQAISYTRKTPKRQSLPKDLPRETVVHDISDEDKVCDCCGGELHQMGEARSEKLDFIPAKVKVIEHIRPKYACRVCDKDGTHVNIKIAPIFLVSDSLDQPSFFKVVNDHGDIASTFENLLRNIFLAHST